MGRGIEVPFHIFCRSYYQGIVPEKMRRLAAMRNRRREARRQAARAARAVSPAELELAPG